MTVSPAAAASLANHDWPGNVRELANVIERAQILAEGDTITPDDLPEAVRGPALAEAADAHPDSLDAVEGRHVREVLARVGGNKVRAASILGVSRRSLYRLLEKHGLVRSLGTGAAD
jgi:two-component system response regulator AtoC